MTDLLVSPSPARERARKWLVVAGIVVFGFMLIAPFNTTESAERREELLFAYLEPEDVQVTTGSFGFGGNAHAISELGTACFPRLLPQVLEEARFDREIHRRALFIHMMYGRLGHQPVDHVPQAWVDVLVECLRSSHAALRFSAIDEMGYRADARTLRALAAHLAGLVRRPDADEAEIRLTLRSLAAMRPEDHDWYFRLAGEYKNRTVAALGSNPKNTPIEDVVAYVEAWVKAHESELK